MPLSAPGEEEKKTRKSTDKAVEFSLSLTKKIHTPREREILKRRLLYNREWITRGMHNYPRREKGKLSLSSFYLSGCLLKSASERTRSYFVSEHTLSLPVGVLTAEKLEREKSTRGFFPLSERDGDREKPGVSNRDEKNDEKAKAKNKERSKGGESVSRMAA